MSLVHKKNLIIENSPKDIELVNVCDPIIEDKVPIVELINVCDFVLIEEHSFEDEEYILL